MTKEEQKILNESLSKLFKLDSETIASLYNEAGDLVDFSKILDLDKERIQKYKTDNDSQFKRGVKEAMQKFEKELKEKYEIESELVGVDLVDHLVVQKTDEVKSASTKDITKHADYIKLQLSIDKQLKDRDKEWEAKLALKEKEFNKAKLFEKVRERALLNLKARKPILPNDPRKALAWEEVYLGELSKGSYMENGDEIVVLNADGTPLQSPHGKPITFDEYEKDIADRYFDYPKADERSSAGNKEDKGTGGSNGFDPKMTEDEYMARLRNPKITPKERIELTNFWTSKQ